MQKTGDSSRDGLSSPSSMCLVLHTHTLTSIEQREKEKEKKIEKNLQIEKFFINTLENELRGSERHC